MNKNKEKIISIIGVLSLLLIVVGTSFAFFLYNGKGTTENSVTAGTITFSYSDATKVGNGILNRKPITHNRCRR